MNMKGRHLTKDQDLTREEVWNIFEVAKDLKRSQRMGERRGILRGKSLAMIFQKPSTRTRVSFEVGMTQLGGHALYLGPTDLQLNRGETVTDTAKVLSRYVDGIMARVFEQKDIVELSENSSVPVINGLSDMFHPCQALTDLFTIWEKRGKLEGLTLSYVGDGDNNMTYSLALSAIKMGMNVQIGSPKKFTMEKNIVSELKDLAKFYRVKFVLTDDPEKAVFGSDIVNTDVWVSMGREDVDERKNALRPFQLNAKLLKKAEQDALVMHCLPAHRGEEITNEVIDGSQSVVFDQAENRLHVQKAIMALVM